MTITPTTDTWAAGAAAVVAGLIFIGVQLNASARASSGPPTSAPHRPRDRLTRTTPPAGPVTTYTYDTDKGLLVTVRSLRSGSGRVGPRTRPGVREIRAAAKHYGVDVAENDWHQLGKRPHTKHPAC